MTQKKFTSYDWMKSGFTLIPNVLIDHFKELHINSNEFVLIAYLLGTVHQRQSVERVFQIADQLAWTEETLFETLNSLIDKNYLEIELVPDEMGKQTDHYTLRPLFDYLQLLLEKGSGTEVPAHSVQGNPSFQTGPSREELQELSLLFQSEFGRPLSSFESETIIQWVTKSHYPVELIELALKEAVLRQAHSVKYIERILLNWEKENILTVDQAQRAIQKFVGASQEQEPMTSQVNPTQRKIHIPRIEWDRR